jgi:hypothetical protein
MPIQSHDAPPLLISKITPHTHYTWCSPSLRGPSHTSLQSEHYREGILGALSLVTIKHTGGEEFLDSPCSFTLEYLSSFVAEFLQQSHIKKKHSNSYIIITVFWNTVLRKVQYSVSTTITWCPICIQNGCWSILPPFRPWCHAVGQCLGWTSCLHIQGIKESHCWRALHSSQLERFITRHCSFSTDVYTKHHI